MHAKDANFHNSTNLVLHAAALYIRKKPCFITYAQIPRCVKDIKIEPSTFSNEYAINAGFFFPQRVVNVSANIGRYNNGR